MLFNVFINYLDDRTKSTLTNLVADTKVGGETDTQEGITTTQRP